MRWGRVPVPSHRPSGISNFSDSVICTPKKCSPAIKRFASFEHHSPADLVHRIAVAGLSRYGSPTMEKSLDQLIEHLLGEIAVCGPAGECALPFVAVSTANYHAHYNQWRPVRVSVRPSSNFSHESISITVDGIAVAGEPVARNCYCRFLHDSEACLNSD